ncbi:putative proteasome activator subunit 4 [Paratrimastix pyriformis]|uniref:Proteasome activator subunit 4 n=1 Tax=Paratrimastix pyriformis TaxID=342808 RepID=A0ABQ8UHL2_9EUKA|nr:putative proteasome activator subunit 4 [Paratrimastix pyriformis]
MASIYIDLMNHFDGVIKFLDYLIFHIEPEMLKKLTNIFPKVGGEGVGAVTVKQPVHRPQELNLTAVYTAHLMGPAQLRSRHGGLLGLAALVLAYPYTIPGCHIPHTQTSFYPCCMSPHHAAYPYTIPGWMPDVLCVLAGHASDPAPMQRTVKDLFTRFWWTHKDGWATEHRECFTPEQLDIVTELVVAPSYFI